MELKSCQVVILVVYALNDASNVMKSDLFYKELTNVIQNIADYSRRSECRYYKQ